MIVSGTRSRTRRRFAAALRATACAITLAAGLTALSPAISRAQEMAPLPLKYPKPSVAGTPKDLDPKLTANVEPFPKTLRPIPMAPKGTINLALHKKVTSSAPVFSGSLDLVTDGNKEAREDSAVELKSKFRWIQIDLGQAATLSYVAVWHAFNEAVVYHSVIVQLSNDPNFVEGVTTIFNNDQANKEGLGVGKDREYWETNQGRLIDAKGTKARYIRLYSHGSTGSDPLNRYTEVEAYGIPAN